MCWAYRWWNCNGRSAALAFLVAIRYGHWNPCEDFFKDPKGYENQFGDLDLLVILFPKQIPTTCFGIERFDNNWPAFEKSLCSSKQDFECSFEFNPLSSSGQSHCSWRMHRSFGEPGQNQRFLGWNASWLSKSSCICKPHGFTTNYVVRWLGHLLKTPEDFSFGFPVVQFFFKHEIIFGCLATSCKK